MAPQRTYSFEPEDEQSHLQSRSPDQRAYHDPRLDNAVSPPPHYTSSLPLEPPSPVTLSHTQSYTTHDQGVHTYEPPINRYTDRSPSPPPPPQHRTSPSRSRHSRQDSPSTVPGRGGVIPMEDFATSSQDGTSRQHAPSERFHPPGSYDRRGPQPGFGQQSHYQYSGAPIPGPYLQRPSSRLYESSYGSNLPLAAGAATPGSVTPSDVRSSHYSGRSIPLDEYPSVHPYRSSRQSYNDSPYHHSSQNLDATVSNASIDPQNIADDPDDDFAPVSRKHPQSMQQRGMNKPGAAAATTGTAASAGMLGGIFGHKGKSPAVNPTYQPVDAAAEKSAWLSKNHSKRKRNSWLCGIGIGVVILIAIIGGIVGGVMGTRSYKNGAFGSYNNANDDLAANGDLNINSAEIKSLMNNPNLHKVFPGIDYTPWGVQYPLCEKYPPSQNNVTRDIAVLSQLTNTIRLYGTDCNQTEMVLHAMDRLNLKNMKIWLGVWIDTNQTTGDRQLAKMYNILSQSNDRSIFKGAIIGNEALYRAGTTKSQSKQELIQTLKTVKSNFTSLGYDLPVATSDLGDNWDSDLVQVVDYVMSNIHPFFAGVTAEKAAAWTLNFWQQHDVILTANLPKVKQLISETGWPSGGGTDCGGTDGTCASGQSGAVASVDSMNTFMNNWVCQALANGTEYFWFEAFDEPWKVQYNTAGKEWEDKWGLMDSARNLKSGVKIPSCGGKTVS